MHAHGFTLKLNHLISMDANFFTVKKNMFTEELKNIVVQILQKNIHYVQQPSVTISKHLKTYKRIRLLKEF